MTPSLTHYTVLNAMQVGVIDCPPDADVPTLARTMADHRIHCVVVNGELWGIVSDLDLMDQPAPRRDGDRRRAGGQRRRRGRPGGHARARGAADGRARHRAPGRRVARHGPTGRDPLDARHRSLGGQRAPPLSGGVACVRRSRSRP